ncbi:hypothetical protein AGIG_G11780 [Arapaima gigas]
MLACCVLRPNAAPRLPRTVAPPVTARLSLARAHTHGPAAPSVMLVPAALRPPCAVPRVTAPRSAARLPPLLPVSVVSSTSSSSWSSVSSTSA